MDVTTVRFYICIMVRLHRAWSHEVCRASNITLAYMASVTGREVDIDSTISYMGVTSFTHIDVRKL